MTIRMIWSMPLLLAGCGAPPTASERANDTVAAAPTVAARPTPAATPASAFAPDSAQAAADVVRHYYASIAAKRYDEAYRLWEPGAVGMTGEAFAASFANYAAFDAEIDAPGRIDAGAGQRYVTVPVRASGTLAAGGRFTLEGPVTLHRVADIDGATPEQRQWRIRSSDLKPRPGAIGPVSARYRCIDGDRRSVGFDNDAGTATVTRAGRRLGVLSRQRAASGIWYKSGQLELRGKGDAATFSEPGQPPIACTAIR